MAGPTAVSARSSAAAGGKSSTDLTLHHYPTGATVEFGPLPTSVEEAGALLGATITRCSTTAHLHATLPPP
eukprot:13435100-Ditylum_brightwellii.AAC.1